MKRLVLLGCPWLKPDPPQTIQGTQFRTRDIGIVIPYKSALPRRLISQDRDHRQNQAKKPIPFRPIHDKHNHRHE